MKNDTMSPKILVVGSSNVDFLIKSQRLPKKGETVTDGIFMANYGGKGANQALSAARAGGEVTFVSCLGDDLYSKEIIHHFKKEGVDTRFMYVERKKATGAALIMLDENGENYLSVAPGANYYLSPEHIDNISEIIREVDTILLQMEIPVNTTKRVMDLAAKFGKKVIFNLAPFREFDLSYLKKVSVLVVNETEAASITGMKVDTDDEIRRAAHVLQEMGPGVVVITLGAQGALIISDSEVSFVPAFKVKAEDTTAAGDTFCGCLVVALSEGLSLSRAVRFASAASAICVTRMGAQPSVPLRSEIDGFLNEFCNTVTTK
jgi:ribokinase